MQKWRIILFVLSLSLISCSDNNGDAPNVSDLLDVQAEPVSLLKAMPEDISKNLVSCDGSNAENSVCVVICHRPPGNHENKKSMKLSLSAVLAHIDHGDKDKHHDGEEDGDHLGYCEIDDDDLASCSIDDDKLEKKKNHHGEDSDDDSHHDDDEEEDEKEGEKEGDHDDHGGDCNHDEDSHHEDGDSHHEDGDHDEDSHHDDDDDGDHDDDDANHEDENEDDDDKYQSCMVDELPADEVPIDDGGVIVDDGSGTDPVVIPDPVPVPEPPVVDPGADIPAWCLVNYDIDANCDGVNDATGIPFY
ncbi:MAG: hypothetical protein HOO06_15635 [Bdellovibrionaceae bacterium]|jgi:hypothetical protein|nr:hypothetical protein [Pseudobdellovibrionaceae bacterium]